MAIQMVRRRERTGVLYARQNNSDLVGVEVATEAQAGQIGDLLEVVFYPTIVSAAFADYVAGHF